MRFFSESQPRISDMSTSFEIRPFGFISKTHYLLSHWMQACFSWFLHMEVVITLGSTFWWMLNIITHVIFLAYSLAHLQSAKPCLILGSSYSCPWKNEQSLLIDRVIAFMALYMSILYKCYLRQKGLFLAHSSLSIIEKSHGSQHLWQLDICIYK